MSDMTVKASLVADSRQWVAGFKQAETAAKRTATVATQSSTAAQTAAARQAKGMAGIRTGAMVAGAALVAFTASSVKAFNDAAMSAIKLQRVMGGSVEGASAYGQAAKLAGVDTQSLERGLGILDKKMAAASLTGAKASAMTEKLGTEFRDASGNIKPLDQILPALSDKFAAMENGPAKAALAMDLFGRGGRAMIPALNQGSAGMEVMMNRARELGAVVDSEGVAKFKAYRQASRESAMAMEGLQMSLSAAVLPTLTQISTVVIKGASAFQKIPGPVKTATVAVIAFAAAAALLGPKISVLGGYLASLGGAAASSVRGMAAAGAAAKAMATGSLAAEGAASGLASATGAASKGATNMGTGLSNAKGGTLAFAAALAAIGMTVSTLVGKFNATNGALGTMTSVVMAATGPFSALGLAAGAASENADKFRDTDVTMQGLADTMQRMKPDEAAAAWSRMTQGMSAEDLAAASSRMAELGVTVDGVADAAMDASGATQELAAEVSRMKALMGLQTEVQFKQDIMALNQSLKDSKGAFDNSKAGLANQSAALSIASGIANGYTAEVKRLEESGVSSADAANQAATAYVAQANTLAAAIPKTAAGKAAIDALNQAMDGVPGWVPINITATGAEVTTAKLQQVANTARMTPTQKQIFVSEAGSATTAGKIRDLAQKLNMTPKKLRVLLEAAGVEQVAAKGKEAGTKAGQNTKQGIDSQKGAVKASGVGLGGQLAAGAKATVGTAQAAGAQVGAALNQGAINGINNSLGGAIAAAQSAGAQVAAAYKAGSGSHSPSTITTYAGVMLNDGIIQGLRSNGSAAVAAARSQGARVGSAYGSAAEARAAGEQKGRDDRWLNATQEAKNKTRVKERYKSGKKWKTRWVDGPSSGKGDEWRAGEDAARAYADGIASAADEAVKAAAQLRVQTFDAMQSSAKGDFTQAKSASSLAGWGAAQLKAITNFERNLTILAGRGLPQSMLQQIISRGLDAAPLAASLAGASVGKFNQIAAQGAAIDVASANLANTASGFFMDRQAAAGVTARQGASANSFKIYIGDREINELVGVEVNGKVGQIVNRMAYS